MRAATLVGASAALLVLGGCGVKLSERTIFDRWAEVPIREASSGPRAAYEALALHRALPDQTWEPPRLVVDGSSTPAPARLPPTTLLHVEITVYPKISCGDERGSAERRPPPSHPQPPAPIHAAELVRLGAPVATERIWMMAAESDDSIAFIAGSEWLANFLREAGAGATVFFPAYQHCGAAMESAPERLPRRVFYWSNDLLTISARSPFTARVVEACPARVARHDRVIQSYHTPLVTWGYSIHPVMERTLTTGRVVARCARGEARFELGPLVPKGVKSDRDPNASLTASLP